MVERLDRDGDRVRPRDALDDAALGATDLAIVDLDACAETPRGETREREHTDAERSGAEAGRDEETTAIEEREGAREERDGRHERDADHDVAADVADDEARDGRRGRVHAETIRRGRALLPRSHRLSQSQWASRPKACTESGRSTCAMSRVRRVSPERTSSCDSGNVRCSPLA